MKKLMMFAAAMTIAGGAFAAACGIPAESANCTYGVWDLTLSGKTTVDDMKKGYIKTASLKLGGLLVFKNVDQTVLTGVDTTNIVEYVDDQNVVTNTTTNIVIGTELTGDCCVDSVDVFLADKKSGEVLYFAEQPIRKLSVFGAGLIKDLAIKGKSKSVSVESDIAWTIGNELGDAYSLQFVGWGKGKRIFLNEKSYVSNGACGVDPVDLCEELFEPGNWSGYFTGSWADLWFDEEYPFACEDDITCVALYGGTWKSKYNKKLSGVYYTDVPPYSLYGKLSKNARLIDPETGMDFE